MTFDIGAALSRGWDRTTTQTGGALVALFVVLSLAYTVVYNSFMQVLTVELRAAGGGFSGPAWTASGFQPGAGGSYPLAVLELPLLVLGAIVLGVGLVRMLVKIGAMRWFVEEGSESPLTEELFTRRLLWTVGNLIVGLVIYVAVVVVGALFFVVPGFFLATALFFYNYEIVVEGENAIDALSNSWELTKGNRLELFVLGFLFFVISLVVVIPATVVFFYSPTAQVLVSSVLGGAIALFGVGVAAAAYTQLRGGDRAETGDVDDVDTADPYAV